MPEHFNYQQHHRYETIHIHQKPFAKPIKLTLYFKLKLNLGLLQKASVQHQKKVYM